MINTNFLLLDIDKIKVIIQNLIKKIIDSLSSKQEICHK